MAQISCRIRLVLSVLLKRVPLTCRSRFLRLRLPVRFCRLQERERRHAAWVSFALRSLRESMNDFTHSATKTAHRAAIAIWP